MFTQLLAHLFIVLLPLSGSCDGRRRPLDVEERRRLLNRTTLSEVALLVRRQVLSGDGEVSLIYKMFDACYPNPIGKWEWQGVFIPQLNGQAPLGLNGKSPIEDYLLGL